MISHFYEEGVCKVNYLVFDKSNNAGYYERIVCFDDYESPKISLTAPLMYIQNKEINLSDRLYVTDCLEGDISEKIRFSSAGITSYETGIYELYVEARNSYGDLLKETLLLNVIPHEYNRGSILLKEYLIYIQVGEELAPETYLEEVVDNVNKFSLYNSFVGKALYGVQPFLNNLYFYLTLIGVLVIGIALSLPLFSLDFSTI